MQLPIVFDLFVTLGGDDGAILQGELVTGVLQILLLHQDPLEGGRVEAEGSATLEA
ncbi:hypothetical protein D3C85_1835650 [compost metagenome]